MVEQKIKDTIRTKIDKITNLPTLPSIHFKLQDLLSSEDTDVTQIAKVIEGDQAMTSKILKVANSAFYTVGQRKVSSIKEAIVRLGFREIQRILLSVGILQNFPTGKAAYFDTISFWKHSINTALNTIVVAEHANPKLKLDGSEYTAGLLHDLGLWVLLVYLPDEFSKILRTEDKYPVIDPEKEFDIIGCSHGLIGGYLLEKWQLPKNIIDAVTYHHFPEYCPEENKRLAYLVNIADAICSNRGHGSYSETTGTGEFSDEAWAALGLDISHIPHILEQVDKEAQKSEVFITLSS